MNLEEFNTRKLAIENDRKQKINELYRKFALSNSPVKIGDIVTDRFNYSILVDKIAVYVGMGEMPECSYSGIIITKKGVAHKSGKRETVYQSSLKLS